jgi:hypothetical protein
MTPTYSPNKYAWPSIHLSELHMSSICGLGLLLAEDR